VISNDQQTMCLVTSRVWLSLICLLALLSTIIKANLTCRFGPGCYYECHCEEGENGAYVPCDVDTGACPGDCDDGNPHNALFTDPGGGEDSLEPYWEGAWSGPACQTGNVAYQKTTQQSYVEDHHVSGLVVDGIISAQEDFCAMIQNPRDYYSVAWWVVDLHEDHVIQSVSLYSVEPNLGKMCPSIITVVDSAGASHTCAEPGASQDYAIMNVPCVTPIIGRHVNISRRNGAYADTIMQVCEVMVIGYVKKECPGYFGDFCNTTCNCLEPCDPETGHCPPGCTAGWRGDYCQDHCPDTTWGLDCAEQCLCTNDEEVCHHVTGACVSGCVENYVGTGCDTVLPHTSGSLTFAYVTEHEAANSPSLDSVGWTVTVSASSTFDTDHYLLQYLANNGTWITLLETTTALGTLTYIDDGQLKYYMMNELRLMPVITVEGVTYVGSTDVVLQVTPVCPDMTWGLNCQQPCRCANQLEVCNFTNGACASGCPDNYVGIDCSGELTVLTGVPVTTDMDIGTWLIQFTPWAEEDGGEEPAHYVLQLKADAETWQDFQLSHTLLMNLISSDVWQNIHEIPVTSNGTFIYVDSGHLRYNVINELRIAPVLMVGDQTYYGGADVFQLVPACPDSGTWGANCGQCLCSNATEQCNAITGACSSGCAENYVGTGCDGELPQLTGVPEFTYTSTDTWLVTFSPWTDSDVGDEPSYYLLQILDDTGAWLDLMQISHESLSGGSFVYIDDGYIVFDTTNELRVLPVLYHDGQDYPGTAVVVELIPNSDLSEVIAEGQNQAGKQGPAVTIVLLGLTTVSHLCQRVSSSGIWTLWCIVFIYNGTKFVMVVALLMLILHMIIAAMRLYASCTGKHRGRKSPVENTQASNTTGEQEELHH